MWELKVSRRDTAVWSLRAWKLLAHFSNVLLLFRLPWHCCLKLSSKVPWLPITCCSWYLVLVWISVDSACSILSRTCCSPAQVRSSFPSEIPSHHTEAKAKISKCAKVNSDVVLHARGRGYQIYMSVALSVPISFPKEIIKDLGLFLSFCSQCWIPMRWILTRDIFLCLKPLQLSFLCSSLSLIAVP